MQWIYTEKEIINLLCSTLNVESVEFDNKKKQIVINIKMPDIKTKIEQLKKIAKGEASPEGLYQ